MPSKLKELILIRGISNSTTFYEKDFKYLSAKVISFPKLKKLAVHKDDFY